MSRRVSQVALAVRNPPANAGDVRDAGSIPGWGRSHRRVWQPTPVFLPGASHGQRSLAGYSPWGRKESDTTEQQHFFRWVSGKAYAHPCRTCRFSPWVGKIPWRRKWQPTPVFLPGESPWTGEPSGLQSVGSQRVGHD